jgi:transcriptional regulator with XRE-family HTH domain
MGMKVRDVGRFIREQRTAARLSVRKLAQLAGVSNPYLSQIERGLRRPSADILNAIAKALRISAETLYVKAGILDDREDPTDLATAILANRSITERQKQVLIQIYRSFREETERRRQARRGAVVEAGASEIDEGKPGGRVESAG